METILTTPHILQEILKYCNGSVMLVNKTFYKANHMLATKYKYYFYWYKIIEYLELPELVRFQVINKTFHKMCGKKIIMKIKSMIQYNIMYMYKNNFNEFNKSYISYDLDSLVYYKYYVVKLRNRYVCQDGKTASFRKLIYKYLELINKPIYKQDDLIPLCKKDFI